MNILLEFVFELAGELFGAVGRTRIGARRARRLVRAYERGEEIRLPCAISAIGGDTAERRVLTASRTAVGLAPRRRRGGESVIALTGRRAVAESTVLVCELPKRTVEIHLPTRDERLLAAVTGAMATR